MRSVCDEEVSSKVGRVWGLDPEGEIYGAWRDVGVQNMWFMTGKFRPSSRSLTSIPPCVQGIWHCVASTPSILPFVSVLPNL